MNAGMLLVLALPLFFIGYKLYGRYIGRIFGESNKNLTPADSLRDDRDYVPTKPFVLFGHHFASIAGAGPIVGPTIAMVFGYVPVWLWLVLGSVFVGADYNYCNDAYIYYSYIPSYPITCNFTANPLCGCSSNVVSRVYYWKEYAEQDCEGNIVDSGGPVAAGTCHVIKHMFARSKQANQRFQCAVGNNAGIEIVLLCVKSQSWLQFQLRL